MRNQPASHLTSFADHLTEQYGKPDTPAREEFEEGFETFKSNVVSQELRKQKFLKKKSIVQ